MAIRYVTVEALSWRYGMSARAEKTRILDKFMAVTGFLRRDNQPEASCIATCRWQMSCRRRTRQSSPVGMTHRAGLRLIGAVAAQTSKN